MARPERRQELVVWRCLPPLLPAGETLGLARQIIERGFQGQEPSGQACGVDQATGWRRGFDHRPGRWKQGHNPGIGSEEMDARYKPGEFHDPQGLETFPRIEQLKRETPASAALADDWPRRHLTRGSELHHKATRRDDDEAGA